MKKILILLIFIFFSNHLNAGNGFSCSRKRFHEWTEDSKKQEKDPDPLALTFDNEKMIMDDLSRGKNFQQAFDLFIETYPNVSKELKAKICSNFFTNFYYEQAVLDIEDLKILDFNAVFNRNVICLALRFVGLKYTNLISEVFNNLEIECDFYKVFVYKDCYFLKYFFDGDFGFQTHEIPKGTKAILDTFLNG